MLPARFERVIAAPPCCVVRPPVALLSCCELALGVALLWPETAPPDDVEGLLMLPLRFIAPPWLAGTWVLVALLSFVLLRLGVEVCARTGKAAAISAARATPPRSFFIEFFLSC
jgi:hypothetical protein